jgi:hypothetical protein
MARIRSLKPEFWADEELATMTSRDARMLYMGMWNFSDEHSRLRGDPRMIKGEIFPYDDDLTPDIIAKLIDELEAVGKVVRYRHRNATYLYLRNLSAHQHLDSAKVPSRLPSPPDVPDESQNFPDESQPRRENKSLSRQQVAGSRQQVAGGKIPALAAAARAIAEATDATTDEATEVAARIAAARHATNLPGLIRTMGRAGDLTPFLETVRAEHTKAAVRTAREAAKRADPCPHQQPGGNLPHPVSGQPWCVACRRDAKTTTPPTAA